MADMRRVTYSGLCCGLCSMGGRIPGQAQALRDSLRKDGAEGWGQHLPGLPGVLEPTAGVRCHPHHGPRDQVLGAGW